MCIRDRCTAPAQKNSKQDIDPLIYLVAGAGLLPGDISGIAQDRGCLLYTSRCV